MTGGDCAEMALLVQADADGELDPGQAARVAAHLRGCPSCAAAAAELASLSGRIRAEAPYHRAPEALRARVEAIGRPRQAAPVARRAWWRQAVPFGAGFALAASLLLAVRPPTGGGEAAQLVAGHIRALQPGHLTDVTSGDQHTVKPWFDGRLDFAPPVLDLARQGFPLEGGRLDYQAGRNVAVLVYRRRQHLIDVFVWPSREAAGPARASVNGYNAVRWTRDGMMFWAVSDLDARELDTLAELLRTTPAPAPP